MLDAPECDFLVRSAFAEIARVELPKCVTVIESQGGSCHSVSVVENEGGRGQKMRKCATVVEKEGGCCQSACLLSKAKVDVDKVCPRSCRWHYIWTTFTFIPKTIARFGNFHLHFDGSWPQSW